MPRHRIIKIGLLFFAFGCDVDRYDEDGVIHVDAEASSFADDVAAVVAELVNHAAPKEARTDTAPRESNASNGGGIDGPLDQATLAPADFNEPPHAPVRFLRVSSSSGQDQMLMMLKISLPSDPHRAEGCIFEYCACAFGDCTQKWIKDNCLAGTYEGGVYGSCTRKPPKK